MAFRIGDRLDTSRYSGWRTLYPVYNEGDLIAFLGMRAGYGKPWRLYQVELTREREANHEGCKPSTYEDTARLVAGKERALEYLGELTPEALAKKYPTRKQLIEAQLNSLRSYRDGSARTLARMITRHGERVQQREALTQVLAQPDFVVGNQRYVLVKLLQEVSAEVETSAAEIEATRADVARGDAQLQRAADGYGVVLGDLMRPNVPTGTEGDK